MVKQQARRSGVLRGLGVGVLLVQLLDIAVHAATNQLEPVRVASNLIVIAWAALVMAGRNRGRFVLAAVGSVGAYLGLNFLFLFQEGLTNPNQGGQLRVTLFVLVGITLVLSTLLTYLAARVQRS